ncbi:MAG: YqeG family HAD IIIA-type phosphatase [Coriobacteriia bacterium]
MANLLTPDLYVTDVHRIDLDALADAGIDTLLVDLDNTLLPRDTNVVPDALRTWAATLAERGFKVCLVSNNWHDRVHDVAAELGFSLVAKAIKPLPFAFLRALKLMGSRRGTAATVGDQIFTDVLGGNLLGMRSVLVQPLSDTDLPHTLLLRRIERFVLAGRRPLP